MRKILLSTLILALALAAGTTAMAQNTYHPITDGCTWSVSNEKYMTAGDTVLDGKTYLKLYRQVENQPFEFSLENAEYFAAIRDDSTERKVYAYLPAGVHIWNHNQGHHITDEASEVMLYDFSPQLGNIISYYTICPSSNSATEIYASQIENVYVLMGYENGHAITTYFVDSDSLVTMSDGAVRRRILLETDGQKNEEVWIEGIGRLNGFDDRSTTEAEPPFKILLCYSDSTGATYKTGFDFDDLDDCYNYGHDGGNVQEMEKPPFHIYPNPTQYYLHIAFDQPDIECFHVNLINDKGQTLVSKTALSNFVLLNVEMLNPGLYFLEILLGSHRISQKIIKL